MKADLHVHSKCSTRPSQWILQKIGCPESFTSPKDVYRIARRLGMDLVTITDHNTIQGVLEIAHLPDVLIGEEITTYFPEDGCKVHVLAYDLCEAQHEDIQKVRENIYDLVTYLKQNAILHAVAHPLYSINGKLTVEHFEKMLLLFQGFELNGARNDFQNRLLRALLAGLDRQRLISLADRCDNGFVPLDFGPKWIIGGSDDHSSLNIARCWTSVPDAQDIRGFLRAIAAGEAEIKGTPSTPLTMAHNLYGIAYQYYRDRFQLTKHLHKDVLLRFFERMLNIHQPCVSRSWSDRVYDLGRSTRLWPRYDAQQKDLPVIKALWKMSQTLVTQDVRLLAVAQGTKAVPVRAAEKLWHRFMEKTCDALLVSLSRNIAQQLKDANIFNIFGTLGASGALYSLMAPYFVAFAHFTKDKGIAREVSRRFGTNEGMDGPAQEVSVAHFSDTILEVNGVARTLIHQLRAAQRFGKRLVLVTCEESRPECHSEIVNFKPIAHYTLPEYPELSLKIPPFLKILRYCFEQEFTQIHSATPGPMGLTALAVARILSIPIVATYHTAFPQYVQRLTGDEALESLTWRYMIWYYNQMDRVYVPSMATARELAGHGVSKAKIKTYPRGVDVEQWSPKKYSPDFRARWGLENKVAALYVGRISKEKDLDVLCRAFRQLHEKNPDTALVVVGDGPYREEMEQMLSGMKAVFTGYLSGGQLCEACASCDFLVFPSTTDTFGNVVLEAQACGLPVIVSDCGGPQENVIPGRTGWIFKGRSEASLLKYMESMCAEKEKRVQMGREARKLMEGRTFEAAFLAMWDMYGGMVEEADQEFLQAV